VPLGASAERFEAGYVGGGAEDADGMGWAGFRGVCELKREERVEGWKGGERKRVGRSKIGWWE